jgi:hypothetical protein
MFNNRETHREATEAFNYIIKEVANALPDTRAELMECATYHFRSAAKEISKAGKATKKKMERGR